MSEFVFIETSNEDIQAIMTTLEEDELIANDYESQHRLIGWKGIVVGACCFLIFNPTQSQGDEQCNLVNIECSIDCNHEMVEEYSEFITGLEDDIKQVQGLIVTNTGDYINADEIQEEIDIIDEYMSSVRGFYKYRSRTLKL